MKTITELNEEYLKKIVKEKDWNSLSWHRGFVEDSRMRAKEIPLFLEPKEFKKSLDNLYESLERKEHNYNEDDFKSICAANKYIASLKSKKKYVSPNSEIAIRKAAIRDKWGLYN
jgi:hypothetical protein